MGEIVPARLHFCWIGSEMPWVYAFAVLSAAARSGMDEILLHHTDELAEGPALAAMRAAPRVALRRVDAVALLKGAETALGVDGLVAVYGRTTKPAQQADMLRVAILYLQGGIYLDLDTVVVADLRGLLGGRQFIGCEYIVWPGWVRKSRNPFVWARALGLDVLRKGLRVLPGGWRGFRLVENWYFRGINNAVLGGVAGAPLFAAALRAMAALPDQNISAYALGPDLFQRLVADVAAVVVHKPGIFYPLPPEISEHWFRFGRAGITAVLRPETLVVHWYASVRSRAHVARIDPDFIRAHRQNQLYAALIQEVLPQV